MAFLSCGSSHADDYQYWEELSDSSKLEVIKSLNIDVNVSKLYLHQIMLSDDSLSEAILDTLCMPSEGNKRMLYFRGITGAVLPIVSSSNLIRRPCDSETL